MHVYSVYVPQSVIAWLLIGLIAGWLAGKVSRGRGFGCIADIFIGLIGALLGHSNPNTTNRYAHLYDNPQRAVAESVASVIIGSSIGEGKGAEVIDIADGKRAKQFVVAVEDIGVVRVGMDSDHLLHGEKVRFAIALDRQMPGEAPR